MPQTGAHRSRGACRSRGSAPEAAQSGDRTALVAHVDSCSVSTNYLCGHEACANCTRSLQEAAMPERKTVNSTHIHTAGLPRVRLSRFLPEPLVLNTP